jgi:predicted AAA+ superfamily ATPase
MVPRDRYLDRLSGEAGCGSIKMLTGIRRGGKSHLLHLMIDRLRRRGVDDEHIAYHNFENCASQGTNAKNELQQYLEGLLKTDGEFYVFLDEIQTIPGWEKTLSLFSSKQRIEFFIAASGTSLRKLAGKKNQSLYKKYTEIKIHPLSYSEYRKAQGCIQSEGHGLLRRAVAIRGESLIVFEKYMTRGGFPGTFSCDDAQKNTVLNDIYSSIVFYDVISKYKVGNPELLKRIILYVFEHIGAESSAKKLKEHLISKRYTKDLPKIQRYLNYLEEALFIKKVRRVNVKTKKIQHVCSKYYAGDHALVFSVCGSDSPKRCSIMKNILVNELEIRGFNVYWGAFKKSIVEFVAEKGTTLLFIQTVNNAEDNVRTLDEKISALRNIPLIDESVTKVKYLLFFSDTQDIEQTNGEIKQISLNDFLLRCEY